MKTKFNIALGYFFIAGIFGELLRLAMQYNLGFVYKNFLNTHSHIALLGWLYNLFIIYIQYNYFENKEKSIERIFWASQITFLGMLFTFPFVGYAFSSILFSTLYLFTSYWLVIKLFTTKVSENKLLQARFIKTGGIFLVLSSFGPYALGFIMAKELQGSIGHHLSIYWFLHFLFNGFFVLLLISILIEEIKKVIHFPEKHEYLLYITFAITTVPLFAQFATLLLPSFWIYALSFIAASFQIVTLYCLKDGIKALYQNSTDKISKLLFALFTISFALKLLFQVIASIPETYSFLTQSKSTAIIGFVHLIMLGMFTTFFIWYHRRNKLIKNSKLNNIGIILIISGIISTEILLFGQSFSLFWFRFSLPYYFPLMYGLSSLIPTGIALILLYQITNKIPIITEE